MTIRARGLTALLVGVLAVTSLAAGVNAQSGDGEFDLDSMVETYNANVDAAPDIARGQLAGETVELRVGSGETVATADTGTAYWFVTADDGRVTAHGEGDAEAAGESATIRIRTSEATMARILASDDPGATFDDAYENGEIKVSGIGITNAVRVELAKFAVWLGKLFGLL